MATSNHKNIQVAFLAAQRNMGYAKKGVYNPFTKKNYADLSDVIEATYPALLNEGIFVTQPIIRYEGEDYVRTSLIHADSDTSMSTEIKVMTTSTDPQKFGSAVTYARRYGLQAICGISADDDDGTSASEGSEEKQATLSTGRKTVKKKVAPPTQSAPPQLQPTQQAPPQQQIDPDDGDYLVALDELRRAESLEELGKVWSNSKAYQAYPDFKNTKDRRKAQLTQPKQA